MNSQFHLGKVLCAGMLAVCAFVTEARASVVIAGTRVIYPAHEAEVTVKLSNDGRTPALTQVWLDEGDPNATPATIEVPFTVTPPVARIDPGKAQTIRIIHTGEPLPQDKESVFWLNMLEVPPKPGPGAAAGSNTLQMAFRTRIKLFYRPDTLRAGDAGAAPSKLRWRLAAEGDRSALQAFNPTPFHVSLSLVEVTGGGKTARFGDGGMVGPGETRAFPLQGDVPESAGAKLLYHAINDYGGVIEGEAALDQASPHVAPSLPPVR